MAIVFPYIISMYLYVHLYVFRGYFCTYNHTYFRMYSYTYFVYSSMVMPHHLPFSWKKTRSFHSTDRDKYWGIALVLGRSLFRMFGAFP